MRRYFIYLLKNKINGKIYIGKTKKRICERMSDHRYHAKIGITSPISRAIKKYGWNNFIVSIILECKSESEMNVKEPKFIKKFRSMYADVGYNIICKIQDHSFTDSKSFKNKQKMNMQGHKSSISKSSIFVGVRWWQKSWYCQCTINGKPISKKCKNEIESAELYDKICLFHYGNKCILNFPDKKRAYLKENLKDIFNIFINGRHSKPPTYISWDKSRSQWVYGRWSNGKRQYKRFKNVEDAIRYRDEQSRVIISSN